MRPNRRGGKDMPITDVESERGLRRQALEKLDKFIVAMEQAPFPDRQRFVIWLINRVSDRGCKYNLCTETLELRIVSPTLLEWPMIDPNRSEPHRWLGGFEHLRLAMQIDPADHIARGMLVRFILNQIGMNTHEIPTGYGYLGEPNEGFATLDEAEQLILGLPGEVERKRLALGRAAWKWTIVAESFLDHYSLRIQYVR
jgi:hypothetical protein